MQQIVNSRPGGRAVVGGRKNVGGITQRPVRRDRPGAAQAKAKFDLRSAITYLPWVGRIVLVVIAALLLFAGYRAAASANFFRVKNVDITGTQRVTPDEIQAIVRRDTQHTGVWNADVAAIRTDIEQLPWVRNASVSRVLPDGLRVRITERTPYAIVHTENSKFVWVDQDAVILGPMALQRDQLPPFFIRGWDAGWGAETANRGRLELYQSILTKWQALGLAAKVSELDLTNPKFVMASLGGEYSQVTVKLLTTDYGEGLQRAFEKLNSAPNASEVTSVTVLPQRTILDVTGPSDGTEAEVDPASDEADSNSGGAPDIEMRPEDTTDHSTRPPAKKAEKPAAKNSQVKTPVKPATTGKPAKPAAEKAKPRRSEPAKESNGETRSRRVK